jgi:uncharacterized protein involved in exopolysaccharide biosynthesis
MTTPDQGVPAALLRRWWLVLGTPIVTAALAVAFVLLVTPSFQAATSVRLVEDQDALGGGALAGAAQSAGGLGVLASLTGRGVPLQTEMAVLSSRGMIETLVDEMGLRLEVRKPTRTPRSSLLSRVVLPLDGPEGDLDLRRQGDGSFRVSAKLLVSRDPFRVIGEKSYEQQELGTVAPGQVIPLEGTELVLAEGAGAYDRILLRLDSRDRALERFESQLSVTRPQRDADVVRVSLNGSDPFLAAEAANRLVGSYLDYREALRVREARRSFAFLATQLDSLGGELRAAEEELRRFREARDVVAPEAQVSAEVERLAELKGRRDLLQAERSALSQLLDDIAATPLSPSAQRRVVFFPTLIQSQATAELLRLLGELENERAEILDRRTADARGVQLIGTRIRELEGELRAVADTYLEGLSQQVAALDVALAGFEGELDQVPEVEMEYLRRRRHVELLTELSLFLETRQKEAELAAAREGVGAYVLGHARPPQEPVSPKPTLTVALALLVGLGLGVAAALVMDRPSAAPTAT